MTLLYLISATLLYSSTGRANAIPQPHPQVGLPGTSVGTATQVGAGGEYEASYTNKDRC